LPPLPTIPRRKCLREKGFPLKGGRDPSTKTFLGPRILRYNASELSREKNDLLSTPECRNGGGEVHLAALGGGERSRPWRKGGGASPRGGKKPTWSKRVFHAHRGGVGKGLQKLNREDRLSARALPEKEKSFLAPALVVEGVSLGRSVLGEAGGSPQAQTHYINAFPSAAALKGLPEGRADPLEMEVLGLLSQGGKCVLLKER